jgi:hypothetical protein
MGYFDQVIGILNGRFPGEFVCNPGNQGRALGLEIRRNGRPGYAQKYESPTIEKTGYASTGELGGTWPRCKPGADTEVPPRSTAALSRGMPVCLGR